MERHELPKEHRLILLGVKSNWSEGERAEVEELLGGDLNWKEILGQLYAHRIAGLFYHNLSAQGVHKLHKEAGVSLRATQAGHLASNQELVKVIEEIADALNEQNVSYAVLKGPIVTHYAYRNLGIRTSSDIDLLVHPGMITPVVKVLQELGHVQGKYDAASRSIVPISRAQAVLWRTYTHQLWPFRKVLGWTFLERCKVDINFSLEIGQQGSDKDLVEAMLSRRIPVQIGSAVAYSLCWEDFLLHLCLHVAKEAMSLWAAKSQIDLTLYKFCDVQYAAANLPVHWARVLEVTCERKLEKEMYYALFHTELLFPGTISPEVLKALKERVCDTAYLEEIHDGKELTLRWDLPFLSRVFDYERFSRLPGTLGAFEALEKAMDK